jgi:hypothetical protein
LQFFVLARFFTPQSGEGLMKFDVNDILWGETNFLIILFAAGVCRVFS